VPQFGEIYWKQGPRGVRNTAENHPIVILGKDSGDVIYSTLSSRVMKFFKRNDTDNEVKFDIEAASFFNFRKYPYVLDKDTCLVMSHGVERENVNVFQTKLVNRGYRKLGKMNLFNKRAMLISLPAAVTFRLSTAEMAVIVASSK
jgi:hypothetical protein